MEGSALLAGALAGIILLTLLPSGSSGETAICIVCGPHAGADVLFNIAIFLPVGASLALIGTPWRVALATSFGISLTVELLQLALPIGRVASASDLVSNVVGAAVGLYLTRRRRAILYPRSPSALRYATAGAGAWLLVLLATAVLLRPAIPEGQYFAQWEPVIDGFERPAGRVVAAGVAGIPAPDGRLVQSEELRAALRRRLQVDVRAEFGAPSSPELTGVFRLATEDDEEIMLVAQRGPDLFFRTRVLATGMRLFTPSVVMFGALEAVDPMQKRLIPIEGRRERGVLRVSAYGGETVLPLHSGIGWMFLVPPTSAILEMAGLATALWIGFPLLVIGYWTGRRARRKARRAGDAFRLTGTGGQLLAALPALALLIALGLAGIPLALGLAVPDMSVWAATAIAVGLGMLLGTSSALSHDDRAHGLSAVPSRGPDTAGARASNA